MAITSAANPRLRQAIKLRSGRQRKKSGLIIVDGVREIARALAYDCRLVHLFVATELPDLTTTEPDKAELRGRLLSDAAIAPQRWQVESRIFERLQFGNRDEGIVAVFERPTTTLDRMALGPDDLFVVIDQVENPGNAGAVLRNADAAGFTHVVFCDPHCELFSPAMIRASLGTCFSTHIAEATQKEIKPWAGTIRPRLFAARPEGRASIWQCDFRGASGVIFGSESRGLEARWDDAEIMPFHIPMAGIADSLNLSASVAVTLYEASRQRKTS